MAGTEASIVKEKSDFWCCGLYTTWQVLVPVKVSVTERLLSAGVRDVADDGSSSSVPSPLKVSPLRITFVPKERDAV